MLNPIWARVAHLESSDERQELEAEALRERVEELERVNQELCNRVEQLEMTLGAYQATKAGSFLTPCLTRQALKTTATAILLQTEPIFTNCPHQPPLLLPSLLGTLVHKSLTCLKMN